jgi:hypothetical protein
MAPMLMGDPESIETSSIPPARRTMAPMAAVIHMTTVTRTVMIAAMELRVLPVMPSSLHPFRWMIYAGLSVASLQALTE